METKDVQMNKGMVRTSYRRYFKVNGEWYEVRDFYPCIDTICHRQCAWYGYEISGEKVLAGYKCPDHGLIKLTLN